MAAGFAYDPATGRNQPLIEELSSGSWAFTLLPPNNSDAALGAISCPVLGWCEAVGGNGNNGALAESGWGKSWSASSPPLPGDAGELDTLSCPGVDACVATAHFAAVGNRFASDTLSHGVWTDTSPGALTGVLDPGFAVACLSTTSCVASTEFGAHTSFNAPTLGQAGWNVQPVNLPSETDDGALLGASCTAGGSCTAVGVEEPTAGGANPMAVQFNLPSPNIATTTRVLGVPPLVGVGMSLTYSATVTPPPSGGDVTFIDQTTGQTLCTGRAVSNGTASSATTAGNVGSHRILAAYSGNSSFVPSYGSATVTVAAPCPTGVTHHATGEPWAVAATVVDINGRNCPGYWVVTRSGGVITIGAAKWMGDASGRALAAPIIGIAATPDHGGYYLLGADGGVFTFGDAHFHGSTGAMRLDAPVVSMAVTPNGTGYWLAASDGGIFTFGNAPFHGSLGGIKLARPVVAMTTDGHTSGYWMVASDGGVFSFDAPFYGSAARVPLAQPVVGMSPQPDNGGYRLVARDGGVFDYGDATFYGSLPGLHVTNPGVTTMTASIDGRGYYLINAAGQVWAFGDAPFVGNA